MWEGKGQGARHWADTWRKGQREGSEAEGSEAGQRWEGRGAARRRVRPEQSNRGVRWSHRPGEEAPAPAEGVKAGSLEEAGSERRPEG